MNILSLFDGISCGQVALKRCAIPITNYFASEIAPDAIKVTQTNFPNTIQLGDINNYNNWHLPKIDLILAGSPCQDFSTLNTKRLGLNGTKSSLFYKFVECLNKFKPKYFLLENNANMPKTAKNLISKILNVEPILLNSSLVSAQMRKRLYWTNIPNVTEPFDKNILFKDICNIQQCSEIKLCPWALKKLESIKEKYQYIPHYFSLYNTAQITDKHYCLTTHGTQVHSSAVVIYENNKFYLPNPEIWEKLQTLPEGYTACLTNMNKRKFVLGNAWTVDIIVEILKHLKENNNDTKN